jgi:hypothetical protein
MTCAPFDVRAASVDGLVKTLVGADGDGKILAGWAEVAHDLTVAGLTEIHGRYGAGWRSTMDRPCRQDLTITPTVQLKRAGLRH